MDESKQPLKPLDLLDAPDRWNGILGRTPQPDLDPDATLDFDDASTPGLTPGRRLGMIAAALIIGLATTAALVVAFNQDGGGTTPATPMTGRIFFTSVDFAPEEPGQIYSMAPDGSDVVRLSRRDPTTTPP
jgi:hypothetical protein